VPAPRAASTTTGDEWFGNVRGDILSGLVVALALIPEAIAFSIIAGVDPKVGLYASFSIAVITAIVGGRPGMISAATAATAVLMVTLVRDHGLQYLLAATVLAGVLQIIAGALRLGYVMRFVSRSVMTGFVNALAILIFMAQLPELVGVPWLTYVMVAAGSRSSTCSRADEGGAVAAGLHRRADRVAIAFGSTCARSATWASCRRRCRSSCCPTCR
jgi:sulfate permease, SulP family